MNYIRLTTIRFSRIRTLSGKALFLNTKNKFIKGTRDMSKQKSTEIAFHIQRIYTKDMSFEAPKAPKFFDQEWRPDIKLDLDTVSTQLDNDVYEVVLRVTVTVFLGTEATFLSKVQQAGIFSLVGIEAAHLVYFLEVYRLNILFPYVRECIISLITLATFPQLHLEPVNFEALFINYIKQKSAGESTSDYQDS